MLHHVSGTTYRITSLAFTPYLVLNVILKPTFLPGLFIFYLISLVLFNLFFFFRSRVDFGRPCALTSFKLFLSQFQIFTGNNDRNTEEKNIIYDGLLTRWLRIVANTRHRGFCLRAEFFGVKQKPGICHLRNSELVAFHLAMQLTNSLFRSL